MSLADSSRTIFEISGADRLSFLQGIVTQDVALLETRPILFSALLSPQGKVLHDFFLVPHGENILIDTAAVSKDTLLKRLFMYKLRAKVNIRERTDLPVSYAPEGGLPDPRHPLLPTRVYGTVPGDALSIEEYHKRRLSLGIPDGERDITEDDVAMDAGYDLLNAISFTKGCYVGQEVTARMHYKNIARRGFYRVESDLALPVSGTPVMAGHIKIGTLRGTQGTRGLAMLRFDALEDAQAAKTALTVDNISISATLPEWLMLKFQQFQLSRPNQ